MHETGAATRIDQINGINLLVGGTITNVNGPRGVGDIAQGFAGSSNLESTSSATSVVAVPTGGGKHCLMGWFYVPNNTPSQSIGGRWGGISPADLEYWLHIGASTVAFYNGGSAYYSASLTAPAVNNWYFVVGWRDSADGKVRICIDNGTVAVSSLASNPTPQNLPIEYAITGSGIDLLTGRLSRFGWINGDFLTPTEITWMYNVGLGRDWLEIKRLAGF